VLRADDLKVLFLEGGIGHEFLLDSRLRTVYGPAIELPSTGAIYK